MLSFLHTLFPTLFCNSYILLATLYRRLWIEDLFSQSTYLRAYIHMYVVGHVQECHTECHYTIGMATCASHCLTHSDMLDSDDVLYIVISVIRELHCVSIWLRLLLCHSCMSGEQKEARCRVGWWEGSCRLGWTFPSPCFIKLCTVLQDYHYTT